MKQLPKYISQRGIDYVLVGDYYIPLLTLAENKRAIGKWGQLHRSYLKEYRQADYSSLRLSGQLWPYLAELDEQAQDRYERIFEQLKQTEGVTEDLKRQNQMEWVRRCNNIHNRAEEIILHEMVYT